MPADIAPEIAALPPLGRPRAHTLKVRETIQAIAYYGVLGFGIVMPITLGIYGTLTH